MRTSTSAATQTSRNGCARSFSSRFGPISKWVDFSKGILNIGYHQYRAGQTWSPAMNVYEGASQYVIVVDLAGVRGEEIDLHIGNESLVLSGERAAPAPPCAGEKMRINLMEIEHGKFRRSVELPGDADEGGISASYRSGFLWVSIPKRG